MLRTDRNNNPIAAAVRAGASNALTRALEAAGNAWTWGDAFPGNASMVTIKILGNAVEGARAILGGSSAIEDWYRNHTGKQILAQLGISSGAQFAAAPKETQDRIIAAIYKAEGGSGQLLANSSSPPSPPQGQRPRSRTSGPSPQGATTSSSSPLPSSPRSRSGRSR